MFSPIHFCSYCNDEYTPIEGADAPVDPDEPSFCSDDCGTRYWEAVDAASEWTQAYRGGAPVF